MAASRMACSVGTCTLYLYHLKKELLLSRVLDYLEQLSRAWRDCRPQAGAADVELQAFVDFHVRYHLLRKEEGVLGNMELRSLADDDLEIVRSARRVYLGDIQADWACCECGLTHCDHTHQRRLLLDYACNAKMQTARAPSGKR